MAGSSLRRVRSPDAPKMTRMQSSARLGMAAELGAKRRQQLFSEGVVAARSESREQRGRQHVGGNVFGDGGRDRPASFAGVADGPFEPFELRILAQGDGRQIEEP